jgi:hypothetical protein
MSFAVANEVAGKAGGAAALGNGSSPLVFFFALFLLFLLSFSSIFFSFVSFTFSLFSVFVFLPSSFFLLLAPLFC